MASQNRNDGEGSIYYRSDRGNYVGSIVLGWRDGKPIRKKVSGPTRSAVAGKLRKLREAHNNGLVPTNKPMTVEQWMIHWITKIAPLKVRPRTLEGYQGKINDYILPLLGHHRLDRLTSDHIEAAWEHLRTVGNPRLEEPKPLSSATILQTHAILRRALKVAGQRGHIAPGSNPAASTSMDAPSHTPKKMQVLTVEEAKKILAAAEGTRNGARFIIALSLGLRQSEALGLTWNHIDLKAGTLAVEQSLHRIKGKGLVLDATTKTLSSERTLVMPAPLLKALKQHRKMQQKERLAAGDWYEDHDYVFAQPNGRPIDPRRDAADWAELLASADVPHRRLHDARHTAATMLLLQNVEERVVMEILGHSQAVMTKRYQHVVNEMHRTAADKMGQVLWG